MSKKKTEEACSHKFVQFDNTPNYRCVYCNERYFWTLDAEKTFLNELAYNPDKPVGKKIEALEGYIKAASSYATGNFTYLEDTELMKHAAFLIISLERGSSCSVLE